MHQRVNQRVRDDEKHCFSLLIFTTYTVQLHRGERKKKKTPETGYHMAGAIQKHEFSPSNSIMITHLFYLESSPLGFPSSRLECYLIRRQDQAQFMKSTLWLINIEDTGQWAKLQMASICLAR
jgi:hypothetical protein